MNEIATVSPSQVASVSPFSSPAAFDACLRMAQFLATSSMLPEQFRGERNMGNILVIMEMSQRIGCSVLTVAQNLDLIYGRPSFRSTFVIGTVNACGRFTPLRFIYSGAEGTDARGCYAIATDKATGEACEGTGITIKMAKAEGWYGRTGSKWPNMPDQMLSYRAAAFWARLYCPELALGMHTSDEVEDVGVNRNEKPQIRNVSPEPVPSTSPVVVTGDAVAVPPVEVGRDIAVPSEPVVCASDVAPLRAEVFADLKSRGLTWKEVKKLAVENQWWEDAGTKKFDDLNHEELTYLQTRGERIAKMLKNPVPPPPMPTVAVAAPPPAFADPLPESQAA